MNTPTTPIDDDVRIAQKVAHESLNVCRTAGGVEFALAETLRVRGVDVTVSFINTGGMIIEVPCGNCSSAEMCAACATLMRKRFREGEAIVIRGWAFRVRAVRGRYVSLKPNVRS